MTGILIFLIIGGLIGWLASLVMKTNKRQTVLTDVMIGVAGSFLAGFATNGGTINKDLSLISLLSAFAGAVILLGAINWLWRGKIR